MPFFEATPLKTKRGSVVVWTEGVETRLPDADWIAFMPLTEGQMPFEAPMSRAVELASGCFLPEEDGYVAVRWPSTELLEKLRALGSAPFVCGDITPFKYEVVPQGTFWSRLFSTPDPENRLLHIRGTGWDGTLHVHMRPLGDAVTSGNFALAVSQGASAFRAEFASGTRSAIPDGATQAVVLRAEMRAVSSPAGYVDSGVGFEVVKLFMEKGTVELFVELEADPREPKWGKGRFAEKDVAHRAELMRLLSAEAS